VNDEKDVKGNGRGLIYEGSVPVFACQGSLPAFRRSTKYEAEADNSIATFDGGIWYFKDQERIALS
jgi:hypothetical protein